MQIYFLTCNLLVCYIFYDDLLLFLLLEQVSFDLLWLHTFKTKVMFTRQWTDFNRLIFSFCLHGLRNPGINSIKLLQVWFTSVAIGLESKNNSYTRILHLQKL